MTITGTPLQSFDDEPELKTGLQEYLEEIHKEVESEQKVKEEMEKIIEKNM